MGKGHCCVAGEIRAASVLPKNGLKYPTKSAAQEVFFFVKTHVTQALFQSSSHVWI